MAPPRRGNIDELFRTILEEDDDSDFDRLVINGVSGGIHIDDRLIDLHSFLMTSISCPDSIVAVCFLYGDYCYLGYVIEDTVTKANMLVTIKFTIGDVMRISISSSECLHISVDHLSKYNLFFEYIKGKHLISTMIAKLQDKIKQDDLSISSKKIPINQ